MQNDASQLGLAQFRQGSFVTVEGKLTNGIFYIIRSGKVQIQKESEYVEEDTGNVLSPGDFFGVISAMSGHPHIETAIAMTDVVLITCRKDQFGVLIQKNAPIALKIIRSFSRKLRFFDSALTRLSFKNALEEDPANIYHIGEFYHKTKQPAIAAHAFVSYLMHNPQGTLIQQARARLQELKQYVKRPEPHGDGFSRTFQDNEVIFLEHEPGQELYILQQGKVKITKVVDNNEIMLAVLQPGDVFGEMAILENKPRSATAISFGHSVMLAVNKDNFQGMVMNQPQLATKIITLLSERIWTSYRQFANLLINDPLGRAFDTLLIQVEKKGIRPEKNMQYQFEFGTKELITMVGLPPDKGKMIIRQVFDNQKVKLVDGKIQCLDLEELEKTVNYYRKKSAIERKMEKN